MAASGVCMRVESRVSLCSLKVVWDYFLRCCPLLEKGLRHKVRVVSPTSAFYTAVKSSL